jgi:isobutyryl-CoA mutase
MNSLSSEYTALAAYRPTNKVRFVTAASLFDGHDASINIMRRLLQGMGAEVIHLGHNRSVHEVVEAALQEDVQGIAVSSYQGGHLEYFRYMVDLLRTRGGSQIQIFGGGGGVIVAEEIRQLEEMGVRIYSPQDGQRMGLAGMIGEMLMRCDHAWSWPASSDNERDVLAALAAPAESAWPALARWITCLDDGSASEATKEIIQARARRHPTPVVGITGTGGAGKSSLVDELVRRFRLDLDDRLRMAVISIDPSRRRSGGALLGDRIRMNAINPWQSGPAVFMRSLATRDTGSEVSVALPDVIAACRCAGFDLILVETSGIGQGNAAIVPLVDVSLYVMTPEYGAASQLEKIDMLDFADLVAINKFDRRGAEDALRDVAKQVQRNRGQFDQRWEQQPVFGTMASRFNDDGVTALYQALRAQLGAHGLQAPSTGRCPVVRTRHSTLEHPIVPTHRTRYLAEIAETVREYKRHARMQSALARELQQLRATSAMLNASPGEASSHALSALERLVTQRDHRLDARARALLSAWPTLKQHCVPSCSASSSGDTPINPCNPANLGAAIRRGITTLSGTLVPRVALPPDDEDGALLRWLLLENLPGHFPFTAGVFAFKREDEEPTRMFAGEGDAARTNRRFRLLSTDMPAKRLSTAFDSVTLYGADPADRPDIYGKVGNAGVSIATLDDLRTLYDGFDLCDPSTSVSMTINGPAPTVLAMFMNAAIDQRMARFERDQGRPPDAHETADLRAWVLAHVRGTVQADILKEDQGQNTCIFSTEFSLKLMGDIAEYFVQHSVRHFYSVSISGYHIAEAGANPITQLAFTLANGFTYVEAYLARGMNIDDFAPNLSFFFSNGMDAEYTVLGRVARRIWAVAMRERYGASERGQKLKYHVQTSGRSLHAQEVQFNDIRTTLQALIAVYDHCNSLHTNAYDEAITTPTEESVRRALAIQLIIHREWGLAHCENPNQGAFVIEELTELVEEAVLREFERLTERGGVLGAMETGYQRSRIQEESLHYEQLKHSGALPIIGVNTFRSPSLAPADGSEQALEVPVQTLARSTDEEKQAQLARLAAFHARHASEAPAQLARLQEAVIQHDNVFAVLMDAVRCCSLGQITQALFEVGGQYRRSM